MSSHKAKGPASVGALPSHGSTNSHKGLEMNKHSNITAAADTAMAASDAAYAEERRSYGDALTVIAKARHLNELMFMAGESLVKTDRELANAITTGADIINDLLVEARFIIDANMRRAS